MIVTFGHTKGGTGKSTIAINLAIALAKSHQVLLIDGDEQKSSLLFTELRNKGDYTAIALTGRSIHQQVPILAKNYHHVIIDVGGRDSGSLRAALTITDVLVIPIQPRTFDVWAMENLIVLVDEAESFNPKLKVCTLLNLAESQGKAVSEAREALSEYVDLHHLQSVIMRRKVYADSVANGLGMMEMKPRNKKALDEFASLVNELNHLGESDEHSTQAG